MVTENLWALFSNTTYFIEKALAIFLVEKDGGYPRHMRNLTRERNARNLQDRIDGY